MRCCPAPTACRYRPLNRPVCCNAVEAVIAEAPLKARAARPRAHETTEVRRAVVNKTAHPETSNMHATNRACRHDYPVRASNLMRLPYHAAAAMAMAQVRWATPNMARIPTRAELLVFSQPQALKSSRNALARPEHSSALPRADAGKARRT